MNSAFRLVWLSAAACAFVALSARGAAAQETGRRGGGNPAEIERLERERRDREMRDRDLRERQFLLRTMKPEGPSKRPSPSLAWAQIREDFVRLQVVNNDLARAAARGGTPDLKFVSKSAAEIRKVAARLKENLALPEPDEEAKPAPRPAELAASLSALDKLVLAFADHLASAGVKQVDARTALEARRELEEIIELSGWVKKASERLEKAGGRP